MSLNYLCNDGCVHLHPLSYKNQVSLETDFMEVNELFERSNITVCEQWNRILTCSESMTS